MVFLCPLTFFLALLLWFSRYVFFTPKECLSVLFSGLLEHVSLSHGGLEVRAKQIGRVACLRLMCSATFSFRYCFPWNPVSSASRISSKLKWSWVMSLYSCWNKKCSQCIFLNCHILICLDEWKNLYGSINWTWLWHAGEIEIFPSWFRLMVKSITSELFLNLTHLLKTLSSSPSTWQSTASSLCCTCENAFSLGESFIERSSKIISHTLMHGSYPCYWLYLTKTHPLWASASFYLHSTIR